MADQIYRTRANRNFCKDHGIRISGPKLGRPGKPEQAKAEKKQEYQDNTDRIEIEREFSVEKRSYGLGLIVTRLETTQLTSIALSVLTANLFKMQRRILCAFLQFLENCKRDSDLKIHPVLAVPCVDATAQLQAIPYHWLRFVLFQFFQKRVCIQPCQSFLQVFLSLSFISPHS